MAKTTKTTKDTVKSTPVSKPEKKVVSKETPKVEAVKKVETVKAVAPEVKKVEEKAEVKKITAAKEPKKIAAKAEPKKIAAKPAPKQISAAKEPVKIAVKEEKVATPEVVAQPVKKVAKAKVAPAKTKKAEAKPVAETEKKPVVKKVAEKKEEVKKTVAAPKKKVEVKKAVEKAAKPVKKETPKKAAPAKKDNEKLAYYEGLEVEECIALMQAMQVHYSYDDYYALLLDEADVKVLENNIIEGNDIKAQKLNFKEHGFDEDLVAVTLQKVGNTMDIKASDYKELKKQITASLKFKMGKDPEANAKQYLDEFALSEKLLMIGQRRNLATAADVQELIGGDVLAYFKHFFDFAYALLPTWQYNDVKFYEDFAYAVMSQYSDVFENEQLRVQIDVADLYIQHGDYQHGDEMYAYILRDNNIKDYIYFRYAAIYKDIDYNKAKSIAYSSLQYVDDRYTYYPNIMEIINQ